MKEVSLFDILKGIQDLTNAVMTGNVNDIKFLVKSKVSINSRNSSVNTTPLHIATACDKKDIIELIVSINANINAPNIDGNSSLQYAVQNENINMVKFLVNAKASINIRNYEGDTPLHSAVKKLDKIDNIDTLTEIVEFLINSKSNVTAQNKKNETPLYLAIQSNNLKCVSLLVEHGESRSACNIAGFDKNLSKNETSLCLDKNMSMLSINQ